MEQSEILNAAKAHVDGPAPPEVGTWIGRHQAFGLIAANKCSTADAACSRQIRGYKPCTAPGPTWEEFGSRHTGVDRRTVHRIMERIEEFGEAYSRRTGDLQRHSQPPAEHQTDTSRQVPHTTHYRPQTALPQGFMIHAVKILVTLWGIENRKHSHNLEP
jgi:hypothetical protein